MNLGLFVSGSFDSAHVISGHKGKCGTIHGHTYRYEIEIRTSSDSFNDMSMLADFADIKNIVNEVIDHFDHALLASYKSLSSIPDDSDLFDKILNFKELEPTAEVISSLIGMWVDEKLIAGKNPINKCFVHCVSLKETESFGVKNYILHNLEEEEFPDILTTVCTEIIRGK